VLSEECATTIARNVEHGGVAYVTRFRVGRSTWMATRFTRSAAARFLEHWIPAEDLDELDANLVGLAEVVGEYR
jgi:hypothetical protein